MHCDSPIPPFGFPRLHLSAIITFSVHCVLLSMSDRLPFLTQKDFSKHCECVSRNTRYKVQCMIRIIKECDSLLVTNQINILVLGSVRQSISNVIISFSSGEYYENHLRLVWKLRRRKRTI